MTSRKVVALVLAFLAPWGTGHFYFGRRVRAAAWLAVPMVGVVTFGLLLPRLGTSMGWSLACALPFAMMLVAWLASLVDLFVVREGPEVAWWQTGLFGVVGISMPVLVSVVLRAFVLEAFRVPSESMQPNILAGDHLFADKSDRRARYGDMVLFQSPEDASQTFVKRVIARPGDVLEMKRGRPWINGWQVPSCPLGRVTMGTTTGELEVEFLGDASYLVFYDDHAPVFEHAGPFYASPNGVLVLGDDRNDSHDSRTFNGGIDGNVLRFDAPRSRGLRVASHQRDRQRALRDRPRYRCASAAPVVARRLAIRARCVPRHTPDRETPRPARALTQPLLDSGHFLNIHFLTAGEVSR